MHANHADSLKSEILRRLPCMQTKKAPPGGPNEEKLLRLEVGIDNVEQRQYSTSVKVVGLHEEKDEDLK